jgi:hypothetical protein
MPNWCNNGITLRHADPVMIERAAKALQEGKFLQEFIPCPQDLIDTVSGSMGKDTPEQAALEAKQAANVEKYGYTTWYEHNVNEWGTKWDVNSDNVEIADANTVSASFDSAWAPPIRAYEQLMEQGFEIEAFYYEPGMAFVGKWADGIDEYYELGGEDSTTVRASIGEELDDYFAISEQMAQWEEENQED